MTNSAASFGSKVGAALGSAMMGMVLSAGGYNPILEVQTDAAIKSICYINIHIIGVCFLVMLVCFFFYTLEKKYPEILKANEEKRKSGGKQID